MIVKISGAYAGLSPKGILLDVDNITYEVCLTSFSRERFQTQKIGERISLHTIYYIESNIAGGHQTPTLIGFEDEADKEFFQLFTSVAKVGVKTALAAVTIPISAIAGAIEKSDVETLKKLKGIGERTANKIIASLRGKVAGFTTASGETDDADVGRPDPGIGNEALQVLLQLGYNLGEAKRMIKDTVSKNHNILTAEELLEEIYRNKAKSF
ncbi:MAG: Holliday junction ATP-dependent DNA helicase RuvA [Pelotomaculum sp. PtaB.Bin013]|uniref:Holliday junction branch migration complex subunit RuvA n=1 Tax=Pelotomaculum isophthalicicum JI TaxID=947010 RepID=A0A9X4H291_9FIRM|nr:Holliday junction branch migration protein RuvA [Pelotomaculum isophthalicicum]MDF9407113.1 helix-hairpin-helix domain-containing protein [Pelotomaculum isophthalicicum JI]OPX83119.1 MAG: Holliday junction ATP-dependent DNA helicase RuvA [Pelotomaculum sp. PtaB.Bin013]